MSDDQTPDNPNTPFIEGGVYSKMEQGGSEKLTATLVASKLPIRHGQPGKRTGRMVMAGFVDDQVDEGGKLNQWTLEAVPVSLAELAVFRGWGDAVQILSGTVHDLESQVADLGAELASKRPAAPTVEVLERVAREAVEKHIAGLTGSVRALSDSVDERFANLDLGSLDDEGDPASDEVEDDPPSVETPAANPLKALQDARARKAG